MMGQPLRPTNPYSYPFMLQYSDILLSTSLCPSLVDMPPLLDEKEDTSPLVVEPPSCSSRIMMNGMVPTVTVSVEDEQWDKKKAAAQATLDHIAQQEWDEQATQRREELRWARKNHRCESQRKLAKEGARLQEQYNQRCRTSGACPDPITNPLGWCEYTWARQERYKLPKWAANVWSASPMDHKQLAAWMVCSWGLV